MATIKEFKQWLSRFPDDTIVEIAIQESPTGYEGWGPVVFHEIKLEDSDMGDGWEYSDFTMYGWVKKDSPRYGKRFLCLGEKG